MKIFNYKEALYRRNNKGQPCFWIAVKYDIHSILISHGIVGKNTIEEIVPTNRDVNVEIQSKINDKRKTGYKYLSELKDNNSLPVEGTLLDFLNTYLPINRTTSDNNLLPMLAKVYDNTNNKLFKNTSTYFGQYKINGLRCFVSAYDNSSDLFKPIGLKFQSREGTIWNSLSELEDYLLHAIPSNVLNKMVDENYILDGELYLPGHSVNEINHFVKDPNCQENKLIQYWCYDIAIEDTTQDCRLSYLYHNLNMFMCYFRNVHEHISNEERLVVLPYCIVDSDERAIRLRNRNIELGFEGLILRNPYTEYQYGKRNSAMIKFKKSTDGKFIIKDIIPEGIKRKDIPLFVCKNDINDACFECHVGGSQEYQKDILKNKELYIGKLMYVEYGERSGVNQVPFHIKHTCICKL